MSLPNKKIIFTSANKGEWLKKISELYSSFAIGEPSCRIVLSFSQSISVSQIQPVHLVTLACLVQYLIVDKGYKVAISKSNEAIYDYIYNDLDFSAYWKGGKHHVNANTSNNIFNLWRIIETEKDLYAKNVETYLNRNYFHNKDLSAINVSLVEAFYNVFDHAKANQNAFSILRYDENKNKLYVAIADFGIGIAKSVKDFNKHINSDSEAIYWALQDHSTVQSTAHNKGLGMGNILAVASSARILSGNGLIVRTPDTVKRMSINFTFPGTLIYLHIDLNSFEDPYSYVYNQFISDFFRNC